MCLLLTVLKQFFVVNGNYTHLKLLQQHLPLAVLKPANTKSHVLLLTSFHSTYHLQYYQLNSINPRVNHFGLLGGFVS